MTQLHIFENEVSDPELPTRALTVWQPWAWLLVHGHKPIENRPPGFSHKSFRGWFWIHAGQRASLEEWMIAREICRQYGFHDLPAFADAAALPYGAIVGRARITGIIPPNAQSTVPWHFPDQYGFLLADVTPLRAPVACRGYQAFWRVPAPVLAELKVAA